MDTGLNEAVPLTESIVDNDEKPTVINKVDNSKT
jgi:hypothetical protein